MPTQACTHIRDTQTWTHAKTHTHTHTHTQTAGGSFDIYLPFSIPTKSYGSVTKHPFASYAFVNSHHLHDEKINISH